MVKPSWIWKETAEVIGVLGIVGSLIFVAFEIRQNNDLMEAQTAITQLELTTKIPEAIYLNRDLARILDKLRQEEVLTSVEHLQSMALAEHVLRGMLWEYEEALAGRSEIDADQLRAIVQSDDPFVSVAIPENWSELNDLLS